MSTLSDSQLENEINLDGEDFEEDLEQESIRTRIARELETVKDFARSLNFDEVRQGEWFIALLRKVVESYNRNARASYFQQKYPGLPPDELADILISVATRYATITGAITGVAITANQMATLSSAGMTTSLFVSAIGAEMLYLARIQMRLVLDLALIYDLQLDPEDPEDILMIFGYALGVAPTEVLGKGVQIVAGGGTRGLVKKFISKEVLIAIQKFARRLGIKILQRTIIKYAVPAASAAIGSSYNYLTTKSIGRVAKAHFKNRGTVTDELRLWFSKQNLYDLAFPAAALHMAQVDGDVSPQERELYRAMLSRMSFVEHSPSDFQKLVGSETAILDAVKQIEDVDLRRYLIEVLTLMALYDGKLTEPERHFLEKIAVMLDISLDITEVEQRAQEYQDIIEKNFFERTTQATDEMAVKAIGAVGLATGSVKERTTSIGREAKRKFGGLLKRDRTPTPEESPDQEVTSVLEKACLACGERITAEFAFCPRCGAAQS